MFAPIPGDGPLKEERSRVRTASACCCCREPTGNLGGGDREDAIPIDACVLSLVVLRDRNEVVLSFWFCVYAVRPGKLLEDQLLMLPAMASPSSSSSSSSSSCKCGFSSVG
jgi:hypothetical protein